MGNSTPYNADFVALASCTNAGAFAQEQLYVTGIPSKLGCLKIKENRNESIRTLDSRQYFVITVYLSTLSIASLKAYRIG